MHVALWTFTMCTVNFLKFRTFLFLFSDYMWVIKAGIHRVLVRIAKREDADQMATSEAIWSGSALYVYCLVSKAFLRTMSVQNFRTSIIYRLNIEPYTCLFQVTPAEKSDSGQNICEVIKEEGLYIASSNVLVKGTYIDILNLAVSVVISLGNYIGLLDSWSYPLPEYHKWLSPDEL